MPMKAWMRLPARRVAFFSVFLGLALILSYVESQIPVFGGMPGMKLGLSNLIVVFCLYGITARTAFIINIARILLAGFMFGSPYSLAYSLCGGIASFIIMYLLKKTGIFSIFGISMAGGIFHNLGQLTVAVFLLNNYRIFYYAPVLMMGGCATGFLIGYLADILLKRLKGFRGNDSFS